MNAILDAGTWLCRCDALLLAPLGAPEASESQALVIVRDNLKGGELEFPPNIAWVAEGAVQFGS